MQKIRHDFNLGSTIQRIRKSKNLTQDKVIAKMNLLQVPISKSSYAKIETNRLNIKICELVALKIIFDVSYEDFFKEFTDEIPIPPEFYGKMPKSK
ncbi:MAG: XRE family transcriptional regulator [Bacillota bacterium]|nr:MAG: XRE family transcriptional regulator [Bacillota bacterium]